MKNFLLLLMTIVLFSCQQKRNDNTSVSYSDSTAAIKKEDEPKIETTAESKQIGDTIFMNSMNEQDAYIADGIIDSTHSKVFVKFKNEDVADLNAKIITADGKGNIRFNQIIFPDKTSDGPFGTEIKFNSNKKEITF